MSDTESVFREFEDIVRRLRKECPWDREQTHQSLRPTLLEETYEVLESIEANDLQELKKELGDLLLHILLQAVIAEEEKAFTLAEVIQGISDKMVRRHPHVFGDGEAADADAVRKSWEHIKMEEGRRSVLEGVPVELPALVRAMRLQEKASKVGFDWHESEAVWKKVNEEVQELRHAQASSDQHAVDEEFGDLLFSLVNYARFIKIDPEFSLRHACDKFTRRFQYVEERLAQQGKKPTDVTLEELDKLWEEGKTLEG